MESAELLQHWKVIRKRLWMIILLVVVAVAGAVYYGERQVPLYRTSTTLFLNPASPSPLLPFYITRSAESLANTYAEFMRTRSFAQLVAEAMADGTTPEEVQQAITTRYIRDTQFFKIIATHPDPAKAQKLANTTAQVFIAQNLARQQAQQEQAKAQKDPVKELERQRLRELQKSLQDELDYYARQIASLQAQIAELESGPRSEDVDQRIQNLREELIRNQSLRVEVLSSLAQTQASLAGSEETPSVDTAVVVDEAALPTQPLPRGIPRYVLIAVILALGAGLGLAYLLEYIDFTVKTPEELEAIYGLATLGVIGVIKPGGRKDRRSGPLITISEPRSPAAEAYRALRTNIQFTNPGRAIRSLLVTSTGPAEGKTITAANLAVSLAQGGNRVILVDADLRKPRLHRLFEVPKEPGFTNLIVDPQGSVDVDSYLQCTKVEGLWVLPCGTAPPNPAELLGSPRAAEVMDQLKEYADVVVYDSPPVAMVTDAVILATRVDGVLQVVLAGKTRRDLVRQGRVVLEKVGARVLGPVLNRVSLADLGYYSYYYYYGYYQDGHERDEEERAWLRRVLSRRRKHKRRVSSGAAAREK